LPRPSRSFATVGCFERYRLRVIVESGKSLDLSEGCPSGLLCQAGAITLLNEDWLSGRQADARPPATRYGDLTGYMTTVTARDLRELAATVGTLPQ